MSPRTDANRAAISFDEFFQEKREKRKRGKLVGMTDEILEYRTRGASFAEIAEYLKLARGIYVSPRGLAKHVQSLKASLLAHHAIETDSLAPGLPTPPPVPPHPLLANSRPGKTSTSGEAFRVQQPIEGDKIPLRAEPPTEDVAVRYSLASPENQARIAKYNQLKKQSKT